MFHAGHDRTDSFDPVFRGNPCLNLRFGPVVLRRIFYPLRLVFFDIRYSGVQAKRNLFKGSVSYSEAIVWNSVHAKIKESSFLPVNRMDFILTDYSITFLYTSATKWIKKYLACISYLCLSVCMPVRVCV